MAKMIKNSKKRGKVPWKSTELKNKKIVQHVYKYKKTAFYIVNSTKSEKMIVKKVLKNAGKNIEIVI